MLRAGRKIPALCAECLRLAHGASSLAPPARHSSTSAFADRANAADDYRPPPFPGSSSSSAHNANRQLRYMDRNRKPAFSLRGKIEDHPRASTSSSHANGDGQPRPRNNNLSSPRPNRLMKDWRAASPSSSSSRDRDAASKAPRGKSSSSETAPGEREKPSGSRFQRRDHFRPLRHAYDPPTEELEEQCPQAKLAAFFPKNYKTASSDEEVNALDAQIRQSYQSEQRGQAGGAPGSNINRTSGPAYSGHRANLKLHTAKQELSEKDKPKQVNFGQGSALAAFMSQAQKEKQAAAAAAQASPQRMSSRQPMTRAAKPLMRKTNRQQPKKIVEITATTSVNALCQILGLKLRRLQMLMERMGITDTRADKLLSSEDASLVANELGYQTTVVDADLGFDVYASPPPEDQTSLPLRAPIVTIMGHVDHGKTSLLDALRSTQVAAGEAGGITQHIGAFNVPISSLLTDASAQSSEDSNSEPSGSITFLDTPGHAAFAAMRSRGASVTDVAVLVVAADDGVKPQTEEVIKLVKNEDVGLVIAITKCDKPGVDIARVHNELFAAGLEVEALGGDIPCVEVSARTGDGLSDLVETINVVAEVRDLRAEVEGLPSEGRVIESRVDKGKGNVTTVIVTRGTLKLGSTIIAGKAFARVRQLLSGDGQALEEAGPGTPVEVTGWKVLPEAGDQVLEANTEEDAKKAIETRKRREERQKEMGDMEVINEKRRILAEAQRLKKKMQDAARVAGQDPASVLSSAPGSDRPYDDGVKVLNLIIKADFTGTEEAVSNALAEIGNSEARVKIVDTGVGDINDGDLALAKAVDGIIIGFNAKASRQILSTAQQLQIRILQNNVIYRLIEDVKEKVVDLLPKLYDQRVLGEATIQQVFKYTVKGAGQKSVAGCRVGNGSMSRKSKVKIVRDGEIIFEGNMASLKQHKEEMDEVRKGSECGIILDGFEGYQEGDTVQSYEDVERKRNL